MAGGACEDGVLDGIERRAVRLWKSNPDGVGMPASDEWNSGWNAFYDRGGVGGELLGREAEPRDNCRIELEACGRAAYGVFKPVEDIDYALLILDCAGDSCGDIF